MVEFKSPIQIQGKARVMSQLQNVGKLQLSPKEKAGVIKPPKTPISKLNMYSMCTVKPPLHMQHVTRQWL